MPQTWTTETILQLVPDDPSRKKALELALARRWKTVFHEPERGVLWGEILGSSSEPYCAQVDLNGPGFACTCPSKKRPCKHALALLLLLAHAPGAFEPAQPPAAVEAWLETRRKRNSGRASANGSADAPEQNAQIDEEAERLAKEKRAAARAAQREENIRAGIDDLERWLFDLVGQGLVAAREQPASFWDTAAARLVDAQAPGFARLVRRLASSTTGDGWQERLMEEIARLFLATEGYRRIAEMPPDVQADLRTSAGWNQKQEDLVGKPGVRDIWYVLGRTVEEDSGLMTQRTWLYGSMSGHAAMLLSFTPNGQVPSSDAPVGQALEAELVFYPSAYPLRAVVRSRQNAQPLPAELPGCQTAAEAMGGYAAALARNPWLDRYPLPLRGVIPQPQGGGWALVDCENRAIPVRSSFAHGWTLAACSGGKPIGVFGEWNGSAFLPLSVWAEGAFFAFASTVGSLNGYGI